jgi:undecaprenyl-diphosphatase
LVCVAVTAHAQTASPVSAAPPSATDHSRFRADPLGDTAVLATSVGFWGSMEVVLSTGEIRPQQIDASFNTSNLFFADRIAVSQTVDSNAGTLSTIGLASAIGYAGVDVILSGFRDGREAAIVDAFLYAEAASLALGVTDLAKVAMRRPRPVAYIERGNFIANGGNPATYNNAATDSALSFVSGHASTTASLAAVATYLAFARSPGTLRPWLTLVGGLLLTSFVSYERVRAGAHFPTDVVAGSLMGAGVGILIVHLHREDVARERPVWIGFTPAQEGASGGTLSLSGRF